MYISKRTITRWDRIRGRGCRGGVGVTSEAHPSPQPQSQLGLVSHGQQTRDGLAGGGHDFLHHPVLHHVPLLHHFPEGRRHQAHRRGEERECGEGKAAIWGRTKIKYTSGTQWHRSTDTHLNLKTNMTQPSLLRR